MISGELSPESLCSLPSQLLAEGTANGLAIQNAKEKGTESATLKSEDLEVIVGQKEGGTKMEWFNSKEL